MSLLLVTADLLVRSWITAAAERSGKAIVVVDTLDAARHQVAAHLPRTILVDLSAPGIEPAALVELAQSLEPAPAVLAFGPHVHKDRLAAARAAGCQVLSRGQLHADVDAIVGQVKKR